MNVEADAAHVMAEIRTFRRRLDELAAMQQDGAPDPAVGQDGAPQDSGWQLRTRQDVLEAVRETIETADRAGGVTFNHMPNVRIRLEPGGRRAHLEKRQKTGWHSTPLEPEDLEDLEQILRAAGEW